MRNLSVAFVFLLLTSPLFAFAQSEKQRALPPHEDIPSPTTCGNRVVEPGEHCNNCPTDVVCIEGEVCINNKCTLQQPSNNFRVILIGIGTLFATLAIVFFSWRHRNHEIGLSNPPLPADQRAVSFIKDKLSRGVTRDEITATLLKKGWTKKQVSRAFEEATQ
ncbi:hypothetical protein J4430_01735 [Candidatus Woesearchaeota archaeon]|nr:hypothetical protein [Candidatus Woesearchaeota archaeon]